MLLFSCQIIESLSKKNCIQSSNSYIRTKHKQATVYNECFPFKHQFSSQLCNRVAVRDLRKWAVQSISALRAASLLPCHSLKSLLFCALFSLFSSFFWANRLLLLFPLHFFLLREEKLQNDYITIYFTLKQTERLFNVHRFRQPKCILMQSTHTHTHTDPNKLKHTKKK